MLEFVRSVKGDDGAVCVSVFADTEKGHTVYVTHTGALYVAESEKKGSRVRAVAGFSPRGEEEGCGGCDGC